MYRLRDGRVRLIRRAGHAYALYRDPLAPDRGRLQGIAEEIRSFARTDDHTLWLGTSFTGLRELDFTDRPTLAPRVFRYGTEDGLPEGRLSFMRIAGTWRLATVKGLFDFSAPGSADAHRFTLTPDTTVSAALSNPAQDFFRYATDDNENVWLRIEEETGIMIKKPDKTYEWIWDRTPLPRISQSTFSFSTESDGVVWIGRGADLLRYDTSLPFSAEASAAARVRRVQLVGMDSVLFGGFDAAPLAPPRLPYAYRNLRFSYALPFFDVPEATQYRVRLDGFDETWSNWTKESFKEYTNLPFGRYRIEVQARDVYGRLSDSDGYALTILPPWYRTGWAYLMYGILGLGLIFGAARGQQIRLRRQKRLLERQVVARTQEVQIQKEQIERQRDLLEVQATRLAKVDRTKSRFFANITHEFRTPLTLTIGPLEDLLDGGTLSSDDAEQVDLSLRNARRFLRLITQILDVARLEAGGMRLYVREGNLQTYASELVQTFTPLAERRHVTLEFEAGPGSFLLWFDAEQIEKVFGNLLANALKFTPEGGAVRLTLTEEDRHVVMAVSDTGPGIRPDDLAHLFDRFYQTGESISHVQPGTGIGLALVEEIVELHGGVITVKSVMGEGATFAVRLPRGRDHFAPDQIANEEDFDAGLDLDERLARYADLPFGGEAVRRGEEIQKEDDGEDAPARADDVPQVLVVDDNAELRAFVRRHLGPVYRVLEAEDGAAALAVARAEVPDLIVSDVMMPGMDGDALCRAVKEAPEIDFIPVILLTARTSMEGKLQGLEQGADDYLTKPFEMRELVTQVNNLIAQRRKLKARWQGDGLRLDLAVPDVTPADEAFLRSVCEAIEAGMADETFSVARLAEDVGQSRVNLYRRLKQLSDKTPSEWILMIRLKRAAALLAGGAGTVSEVAYGVGFKSVSYFCKCFRAHFDTTPTGYRAKA